MKMIRLVILFACLATGLNKEHKQVPKNSTRSLKILATVPRIKTNSNTAEKVNDGTELKKRQRTDYPSSTAPTSSYSLENFASSDNLYEKEDSLDVNENSESDFDSLGFPFSTKRQVTPDKSQTTTEDPIVSVIRYQMECIEETRVDSDVIVKIKHGNWWMPKEQVPLVKDWALCVLMKSGIMTKQGVFKIDVALKRVPLGDNTVQGSENKKYLPVNLDKPTPSTSAAFMEPNIPEVIHEAPSQTSVEKTVTIEKDEQHQELEETVMDILGLDLATTTSSGKDNHKDLAIEAPGLTKQHAKELWEFHLPLNNGKLMDLLLSNPDIKPAATDVTIKQDKAMQVKQKQIASPNSCLSEIITIILSKKTRDPNILRLLVDAGCILCDCQQNDSVTRRNFMLAVLKKDFKDQLQLNKINEVLFGHKLADLFGEAKGKRRSGAELKSVPPSKCITNKSKRPGPSNIFNWKPAQYRRLTGLRWTEGSAALTRQQHAQLSRASRPYYGRIR